MAAQKKYPDELRERAVKMVLEIRERTGKGHGEIAPGARQLDVHPEPLQSWLQQAEIDGEKRPGTTTDDKQWIAELEREVRELRRANGILKAASAYFARELDPSITVTVSLDEFAVLRTVAHGSGILVTCCHLHPAAAVQVAAARRAAWWCHWAAAWRHLRRADQRSLRASWAGVRG